MILTGSDPDTRSKTKLTSTPRGGSDVFRHPRTFLRRRRLTRSRRLDPFAIVAPLVDVYVVHPRSPADLRGWWHRLFQCALAAERRGEPQRDRCETWSLVPSGRLAATALIDIDRRRKSGGSIQQRDLDRLATVVATSPGGFPSMAALAKDFAFLLSLDGQKASDHLAEALAEDGDDGPDSDDEFFVHIADRRDVASAHQREGHLSLAASSSFELICLSPFGAMPAPTIKTFSTTQTVHEVVGFSRASDRRI